MPINPIIKCESVNHMKYEEAQIVAKAYGIPCKANCEPVVAFVERVERHIRNNPFINQRSNLR